MWVLAIDIVVLVYWLWLHYFIYSFVMCGCFFYLVLYTCLCVACLWIVSSLCYLLICVLLLVLIVGLFVSCSFDVRCLGFVDYYRFLFDLGFEFACLYGFLQVLICGFWVTEMFVILLG